VAELSGEKIDVIPWSDDASVFVANALSPAQVISVDIDEEHRIASVTVPERMLSLAIGREGQNARLAARLTGWRIDIRSDVSVAEARAAAADAVTNGTSADAVEETEAVAAPADAEAAEAGEPVAKPKRTTKKAAVAAETTEPTADTAAEEAAPAAKPKRTTKKAAATGSTEEVAS
jgi:N utilization substance protein A